MCVQADSIHVLQVADDPLLDETVAFPDAEETDSLTVTTTDRADTALDLLEANAIDGIVVADQLSDMAVLTFADTVRETDADIPILLLTESESVASDAVSRSVTDIFRKDVHADHSDLLANRIRLLVERHRSTETAVRARQRLTELAEQSDELLWVFSGDWTEIQFVNSQYESLYGRSVESLQANPTEFITAIHPDDQDRVIGAMQRVSAGESVTLEFRITRPDDEQRWMRAEAQPVVEHGTVDRIVGASRDITERKRRESQLSARDSRRQALERQNERLEEFASVVSHDLRSPLDVARSQLELARIEHDSDHLDSVERAHDRIGQLIDDLLTLARNGETALDSEPVPLQTVIEQCWQTVETDDAVLDLQTSAVVRADPSRLRQLFENLIRNSVEHGPMPPTERPEDTGEQRGTTSLSQSQDVAADLTLTVGELDDGFYVADDGVGIPADERERVFEGGYSLASGPGFGLRIVDEIADTHGWSVAATESADGGARFEITGVEFETA
jgi:PAS domain S-box-containing protein